VSVTLGVKETSEAERREILIKGAPSIPRWSSFTVEFVEQVARFDTQLSPNSRNKGMFGYVLLKFNSHHINVSSNAWSTKCRLIACMST
jgi:hypothetical protein